MGSSTTAGDPGVLARRADHLPGAVADLVLAEAVPRHLTERLLVEALNRGHPRQQKTRRLQRVSEERMKGLEPSTFCMGSASDRSHPFAPVRSNGLLAAVSIGASERKRTRANAEPCHSCHVKPGLDARLHGAPVSSLLRLRMRRSAGLASSSGVAELIDEGPAPRAAKCNQHPRPGSETEVVRSATLYDPQLREALRCLRNRKRLSAARRS
jgi:hypothetical protein